MNTRRIFQRGMTIIELMVGLVVGMLLALAVFGIMAVAEGQRRSTTSVNTLSLDGQFAMQMLDKWVRSAGTGYTQSASYAFGCELLATKGSTQVLPRTATLPAPFASVVPGTANIFRLAPVVILPDQTTPGDDNGGTSDVLVVMGSGSGGGGIPVTSSASPDSAALNLSNTLNFSASDLVLVADKQTTSTGVSPCMVTQVATGVTGGTATALSLTGDYYASSVNGTSITSFTSDAVAINLGNVTNGNPPQFLVLGVGDYSTLYSYDLLQTSDDPLTPVATGVLEMKALYGLDTDGDGKVDTWVKPSGSYAPSVLLAGTTTAAETLQQIMAIKVGLILRTPLAEKVESGKVITAASSISLFSDVVVSSTDSTSLKYTRSLTSTEQTYRFRTVEATIPVRNAIILGTP